jgi:hypothetical protein
VSDQRQIEHRRQIGVRIAVRGDAVAGLDIAFGDVELGLVGDVADHAGLGAGAEQRALRAFENFDALEVGGVDVEVAGRQLAGLIVQVDGDVGERRRSNRWIGCRLEPTLRPRMKILPWPGPLFGAVTFGRYLT